VDDSVSNNISRVNSSDNLKKSRRRGSVSISRFGQVSCLLFYSPELPSDPPRPALHFRSHLGWIERPNDPRTLGYCVEIPLLPGAAQGAPQRCFKSGTNLTVLFVEPERKPDFLCVGRLGGGRCARRGGSPCHPHADYRAAAEHLARRRRFLPASPQPRAFQRPSGLRRCLQRYHRCFRCGRDRRTARKRGASGDRGARFWFTSESDIKEQHCDDTGVLREGQRQLGFARQKIHQEVSPEK
jgi:hypothetical protein